jgi:hypothetical protein
VNLSPVKTGSLGLKLNTGRFFFQGIQWSLSSQSRNVRFLPK